MKIVKIVFAIMFFCVGIIGLISGGKAPNDVLAVVVCVVIAALLLISAFKAPKKKHLYVQDYNIILKNGKRIPVEDMFHKFGYDKTSAVNYLTDNHHEKSSTAAYIIKTIYERYYSDFLNWTPSRKINSFMEVDDSSKRIGIASPYTNPKWQTVEVFNFDDILSYELYDNGTIITKGGLGSAVVGGALFGGVGAVVGSNVGKKTSKSSDYSVKITLQDTIKKPIFIKGIGSRQTGEEILSALDQIVNQNSDDTVQNTSSPTDEIRKYKELLDEDILTQEEFDAKKKELLGL